MSGRAPAPAVSRRFMAHATVARHGERLDKGFPASQAWRTVKRQAMTADSQDSVGLYVGTTSGELWMSRNEGRHWGALRAICPRSTQWKRPWSARDGKP